MESGGDLPDDVDQFVGSVAVASSELHEISRPSEHRSALRCCGDMDAAATAELKQPLVAQLSQGPQEGIERYWEPSRWAVIKDAQRRQRRRQRRILTIATVLLAAATIGWAISRRSGPDHAPIFPAGAVEVVTLVHPGGIIESTASLRGNVWVLTCLQHCSEPWVARRPRTAG